MKDQNAILLVAPSDHVIPNINAFHEAVKVGLLHVHDSKMVTFGIKPTHPKLGTVDWELSAEVLDSFGTSDL